MASLVTKTLVIGSRGSQLALWQARHIASELDLAGVSSRIEIIRTTGDHLQTASLMQAGGKGLFTKEIEEALLAGAIDLAVHSLKDLPTELPEGLIIAAIPEREDARDAIAVGIDEPVAEGAGRREERDVARRRSAKPVSDLVGKQHVSDLQRRHHGDRWNVERANNERNEEERDQSGDDERVEVAAYGRSRAARKGLSRERGACDAQDADQSDQLQR